MMNEALIKIEEMKRAFLSDEDKWFVDCLYIPADELIKTIIRTKTKLLVLSLEHRINSLHIYCRLCDIGINKKIARKCCKCYEIAISRRMGKTLDSIFRRINREEEV